MKARQNPPPPDMHTHALMHTPADTHAQMYAQLHAHTPALWLYPLTDVGDVMTKA